MINPDEFKKLDELKQAYREADKVAKEAKRLHDEHQARLLDEMKESDIGTFTVSGVQFSPRSTIYANVTDRDAFHEWLHEQGLEDEFLKQAEEKQRLNELVRDRLDSGQEMPPGLSFYPREFITIKR